eukprot:Gb_03315 [translate_table: standard]
MGGDPVTTEPLVLKVDEEVKETLEKEGFLSFFRKFSSFSESNSIQVAELWDEGKVTRKLFAGYSPTLRGNICRSRGIEWSSRNEEKVNIPLFLFKSLKKSIKSMKAGKGKVLLHPGLVKLLDQFVKDKGGVSVKMIRGGFPRSSGTLISRAQLCLEATPLGKDSLSHASKPNVVLTESEDEEESPKKETSKGLEEPVPVSLPNRGAMPEPHGTFIVLEELRCHLRGPLTSTCACINLLTLETTNYLKERKWRNSCLRDAYGMNTLILYCGQARVWIDNANLLLIKVSMDEECGNGLQMGYGLKSIMPCVSCGSFGIPSYCSQSFGIGKPRNPNFNGNSIQLLYELGTYNFSTTRQTDRPCSPLPSFQKLSIFHCEGKRALNKTKACALKSPKGFGPVPDNKNIRRMPEEDGNDDKDDEIPQFVFDRMIKRIGFFVGVPIGFGFLLLNILNYLKMEFKWSIPIWLSAGTILIFFGSSALGLTYGALSTSWDPSNEGSLLGWSEAQKNWPEVWKEEEE